MAAKSEQITIWKSWIEACNEVKDNLTKWESDFVDSVSEQLEERKRLSEKQAEILERIYSEKTK